MTSFDPVMVITCPSTPQVGHGATNEVVVAALRIIYLFTETSLHTAPARSAPASSITGFRSPGLIKDIISVNVRSLLTVGCISGTF